MKSLEVTLRAVRATGRKALVPYFMAGVTPDWTQHVAAAVHGGADAVEIGIPFSDPMMDGVVIQQAAEQSLAAGTNLDSICAELSGADLGAPLIAMTYYNLFHHYGLRRAAGPETDIAPIFLAAPSTTEARFARLAEATQGFCYASARMAVTGRAQGG